MCCVCMRVCVCVCVCVCVHYGEVAASIQVWLIGAWRSVYANTFANVHIKIVWGMPVCPDECLLPGLA